MSLQRKIESGSVIDEIPPGRGLTCLWLLTAHRPDTRAVLRLNARSEHIGSKDTLLLEDRDLSEKEVQLVALWIPTAVVCAIHDGIATEPVDLPASVQGVGRCHNQRCVSLSEAGVVSRFTLISQSPILWSCAYCEHLASPEELLQVGLSSSAGGNSC